MWRPRPTRKIQDAKLQRAIAAWCWEHCWWASRCSYSCWDRGPDTRESLPAAKSLARTCVYSGVMERICGDSMIHPPLEMRKFSGQHAPLASLPILMATAKTRSISTSPIRMS